MKKLLIILGVGFVLVGIANFTKIAVSSIGQRSINSQESLNISAFKDITAFILETAKDEKLIQANIKYVKNADEAHDDLIKPKADIVFMSYDDTLSLAVESQNANIIAVAPVHGGILSFSGNINIAPGKTKIGIDPNTGYARVLRYYLHQIYSTSDYSRLQWKISGATNLRAVKLLNNEIDATILNPPYSLQKAIAPSTKMYDIVGSYQGVVMNVNKRWLANRENKTRLVVFIQGFYTRLKK